MRRIPRLVRNIQAFRQLGAYIEGRIAQLTSESRDIQMASDELFGSLESPLVRQFVPGFAVLTRIADLNVKLHSVRQKILQLRQHLHDIRSREILGNGMLAEAIKAETSRIAERDMDEIIQRTVAYSLRQDKSD
jgi:hypothetical protein